MSDDHLADTQETPPPLDNKGAVLEYLRGQGLTVTAKLVILMMSDTLRPLDYQIYPIARINKEDLDRLIKRAMLKKAKGILLVEIYPTSKPWPLCEYLNIDLMMRMFESCDLHILDVLVAEGDRIASTFFRNRVI